MLQYLNQEESKKILKTALKNGGDFADIYLSSAISGTVLLEENKIQRFYRGSDTGCGIRVLRGDSSTYLFTNDVNEKRLLALSETAAEAGNSGCFPMHIDFSPKLYGKEPEGYNLKEVGETLMALNEFARSQSPLVRQVTLGYGEGKKQRLIANSRGVYTEDSGMRKRFFIKVVGEKDGELQTAISTLGDTDFLYQWDNALLQKKTEEAVARVLRLLSAKEAPCGEMTVILSSEAGGTMVHEACGHGLEADHIEQGLSVYKDKIGKKVAAENITVIDDATLKNKYGSFAVDDEGVEGQRNVLIEDGVLKSYLFDIRTAEKMAKTSTGSGRRESYHYTPQVRMSNTYLASGKDEPEGILADTKKGLFVKKMGGGQVNTTNGDFVFEVSEGYLIENGKLSYPIKNATLIGNGPKVLSSIFAVGNDLGFAIGTCGKGGQSVSVGDAQPTLGLKEVIVGGTA